MFACCTGIDAVQRFSLTLTRHMGCLLFCVLFRRVFCVHAGTDAVGGVNGQHGTPAAPNTVCLMSVPNQKIFVVSPKAPDTGILIVQCAVQFAVQLDWFMVLARDLLVCLGILTCVFFRFQCTCLQMHPSCRCTTAACAFTSQPGEAPVAKAATEAEVCAQFSVFSTS